MRKLCGFLLVVLCLQVSAFAGTKTTVAQLASILTEMQTLKKPDDVVANRLKLLELSEPMSAADLDGMARFQPGPQTITQIRVMALASAMLPPLAAEMPATPAPDRAAQVEMMHQVVAYLKRFGQVPKLQAVRASQEYRNGPEALHFSTGEASAAAIGDPGVAPDSPYFRFLGERKAPVTLQLGVELPQAKAKTQEASRMYSPAPAGGTGLLLSAIFADAAGGSLGFERWQTLEAKRVAVFAFRVDRKKSSYHVNYCCFPTAENTGNAAGFGSYGVVNDFQPFKSNPGYHGQIYVEPETGTILRLLVQVDFKPEDPVKQEDTMIDYGPVTVHGAVYTAPVRLVEFSAVALSGESYRRLSVRRALVDIHYAGFEAAQ